MILVIGINDNSLPLIEYLDIPTSAIAAFWSYVHFYLFVSSFFSMFLESTTYWFLLKSVWVVATFAFTFKSVFNTKPWKNVMPPSLSSKSLCFKEFLSFFFSAICWTTSNYNYFNNASSLSLLSVSIRTSPIS